MLLPLVRLVPLPVLGNLIGYVTAVFLHGYKYFKPSYMCSVVVFLYSTENLAFHCLNRTPGKVNTFRCSSIMRLYSSYKLLRLPYKLRISNYSVIGTTVK